MDSDDGFSVRAVVTESNTLVQWVASGPALERGKRWRKLFDTREAAEEYVEEERRLRANLKIDHASKAAASAKVQDPFAALEARGKTVKEAVEYYLEHLEGGEDENSKSYKGAGEKAGAHRNLKGSRGSPFRSQRLVGMLFLIGAAFATDRAVKTWFSHSGNNLTLSAGFESNPLLSGWTSSGQGVNWTADEHASGSHSILLGSGKLSSPALPAKPMQWYRLSFQSKAPGITANIGSIGYGYCSVLFYDELGNQLPADFCGSIVQSDNWQKQEIRFRAWTPFNSSGVAIPSTMRIQFETIKDKAFYIDDVTVEPVGTPEVAAWSDRMYETIAARLRYHPKPDRWEHIPLTMERLRRGNQVRIVFLGDSILQDLANTPLDVYLQRQYPGSRVEIISSTKGGTGVAYYQNHVEEYITRYKPDLLVIGGASNGKEMDDFQSIVDQVQARDLLTKHKTEIMLVTNGWSPNSVPQSSFTLSPTMRELDQKLENNNEIPTDYRGDLLRFAAANDLEFLDMHGIVSEFIYGPAAAVNLGPPTGANGEPYGYWMRDWVHPNDQGRQIMGRILQRYFTPDAQKQLPAAHPESAKPQAKSVEPKKPQTDCSVFEQVLAEYLVEPFEIPVFANAFTAPSRCRPENTPLKDEYAVNGPDF